jgi:hypothetical protein
MAGVVESAAVSVLDVKQHVSHHSRTKQFLSFVEQHLDPKHLFGTVLRGLYVSRSELGLP